MCALLYVHLVINICYLHFFHKLYTLCISFVSEIFLYILFKTASHYRNRRNFCDSQSLKTFFSQFFAFVPHGPGEADASEPRRAAHQWCCRSDEDDSVMLLRNVGSQMVQCVHVESIIQFVSFWTSFTIPLG